MITLIAIAAVFFVPYLCLVLHTKSWWLFGIVLVKNQHDGSSHNDGGKLHQVDCVVCLCKIHEGEECSVLPKCNHRFHVDCIDAWLEHHSTCPLCRALVPNPHQNHMPDDHDNMNYYYQLLSDALFSCLLSVLETICDIWLTKPLANPNLGTMDFWPFQERVYISH